MKRIPIVVLVAVVAIALWVTPAAAQETEGLPPSVTAPERDRSFDEVAPEYGVSAQIVKRLPFAAFNPRTSSVQTAYSSGGYAYRSSTCSVTTCLFWAPLDLPSGATLDQAELAYYDESSEDIELFITRFHGVNQAQDIISGSSTGTPGYGTISVSPAVVIDNATNHYVAYIWFGSGGADTSLQARDVRLAYRLQISPAPLQATFSDVGTGHPFFQHVEALAASGITAGCGSGQFCPDQPVTRGQMAVFLAKALGLHW